MSRVIFHVDMDAFYTSVEQRDAPELMGKPVIVGADPQGGTGRGVVAAASYEARAFGVHSAMPISRAYRLCPGGVYLRGRMKKYQEVSRSLMALLHEYTDLVEPLSIDEAFLDVSAICKPAHGRALAEEIKASIYKKERLNASVGVAPNKFLAKIASDLDKPNGLVVVTEGEELDFLGPLPVRRLWGVGPKTAERLEGRGIRHIRDLWSQDAESLAMGKHGDHILALSRGQDRRAVTPTRAAKSIGHERTFLEDIDDPELVRETLLQLSEAVAKRLRRHERKGRTVTLKYRDQDFVTETRAVTLPSPTDDAAVIFAAALRQLERVRGKNKKVRLLGVSLSKLEAPEDVRQLSLFSGDEKSDRLGRARDQLEERFGKGSVTRASLLGTKPIDPEP